MKPVHRMWLPCAVSKITTGENDLVAAYHAERNKYKECIGKRPKKGADRESETMRLLASFHTKLETARSLSEYNDDDKKKETEEPDNEEAEEEEDFNDFSWYAKSLSTCKQHKN